MNKVVLLGRLTKDIELRYTQTNKAVANFSIAVNRKFKKEGQAEVDFLNCIAWNKTAEFLMKYFVKGQQLALTGRIQTRTWDDTDAKKHYVTEVIVEDVYFADSKKESSNNNNIADMGINDEEDDLPF